MPAVDNDGSSAEEKEEELAQLLQRCRWSMRPRCSGREGAASLLAAEAAACKTEETSARKLPLWMLFLQPRRWLKKKSARRRASLFALRSVEKTNSLSPLLLLPVFSLLSLSLSIASPL